MKVRSIAALIAAVSTVTIITKSFAADLTWDANGADAGVVDGGGTWNLTNLNWYNGSSNVAWTNGNSAILGQLTAGNNAAVGAAIDIGSNISAQNITFGTTTDGSVYVLSDYGDIFNGGAPGSLTLTGNVTKTAETGTAQFFLVNSGLAISTGQHVFALHDSPGDDAPEMRIDGDIRGAGGITVDHGTFESWGTLSMSGNNSYAGQTLISRGRLAITSATALGTTSANTVISGAGTLNIGSRNNLPTEGLTINEPIVIQRNQYTGGDANDGGAFNHYQGAIITSNGSGTTTFNGTITLDSTDARIRAETSTLVIATPIAVTSATSKLSVGGDFAGFVRLTANNTALATNGVTLTGAQLVVDNDSQIGGTTAPLTFNGGYIRFVGGYLSNFGAHPINNSTFNGGIDIDDGTTFTVDQDLGSTTEAVGTISKRGTGTLNLNSVINLRGGQTFWDGGIVNVNNNITLANLHLRSPVVNIGTGGSITEVQGFTSLGQDSTGTNGGPDIAVVNITGDGKFIQTNNDDFNISDNPNTKGTINLSGNGLLSTAGITHLGKQGGAVGTINQTGGTLLSNRDGNFSFVVGRDNGTGVYNLSGGTFSTPGEAYVGQGHGDGVSGSGTWTQTGGTATISNWFVVGREGGKGDVTISGGTLIKAGGGNTPLGEGTNDRGNSFTVKGTGTFDAQTGEVWVSNGLTTTTMNVQESGVFNVNNFFVVGRFGGSNGILNVSGNSAINKAGTNPFIVAAGGGSTGVVNQTGGTVTNTTTETWIGDGGNGTWNFSGGKVNVGLFDVGHNGDGVGVLNVSGTAALTAGTIRIGEAGASVGTINLDGGSVLATEILARNSSGAKTFNFTAGTLSTGAFNVGSGLANTGTGILSPGGAGTVGATAITGTYTQASTAGLAIDISSATSFDSVTVSGAATLAGLLSIDVLGTYSAAGATFDILTGTGGLTGIPMLGGPDGALFSASIVGNVLRLTGMGGNLIPGDYNSDGYVDAADYTVWADHFGQTGAGVQGDGNNDGVVNAADYTVWADHFGQGTPPGAPGAVPEPAALAVFPALIPLMSRRRR